MRLVGGGLVPRGGALDHGVGVDRDAVVDHADPAGLRDQSRGGEPRPGEQDVVGLPLARSAAGVHGRRLLLVEGAALAVRIGERAVGAVLEGVEHLDLVLPHQEHARVASALALARRGGRHPELEVQLTVAEALLRLDHALADRHDAVGDLPGARVVPGIHGRAVEEQDRVGRHGGGAGGRRAWRHDLGSRPLDRYPPLAALVLAAAKLQPPVAERGGDQGRLGLGFRQRQPRLHAGSQVAGRRQIRIAEQLHPPGHVRQERGEHLGQVGVRGGRFVSQAGDRGPGDLPVALVAGMHGVTGEAEVGILFPPLVQRPLHRPVHVDHEPAVGPLGDEPLRGGREHGVVVDGAGWPRLARRAAVERWREVDDRGPGLFGRRVQPLHAVLELREPPLVERQIDATVHAVAGQDDVWPHEPEHPVESFMEIGPGKLPAGVTVLGQPRDRLAREATVDHLGVEPPVFHPGGEVGHPAAGMGDRVAQHEHPLRRLDGSLGRRGLGGGRRQREQRRDERCKEATSCVARGCPCQLAGRSLRTSCAPVARCWPRFRHGHRSAAGGLVGFARPATPLAWHGQPLAGHGARGCPAWNAGRLPLHFAWTGLAPSLIANRWLLLAM